MSVRVRVDFCPRAMAEFFCVRDHYYGSLPAGRMQTIGCWEWETEETWEDARAVGAYVFSRGSCKDLATRFGFGQDQAVELSRAAFSPHQSPITQSLAPALRLLKAANPRLHVVISYSDPMQSHSGRPHSGGIYRAGNWMFLGMTHAESLVRIGGEVRHPRTVGSRFHTRSIAWLRQNVDPQAERVITLPKYRFAMPLTADARERLLPHVQPFVLQRDRSTGSGARGPQAGGVSPSTPAAGTTREGLAHVQAGRPIVHESAHV